MDVIVMPSKTGPPAVISFDLSVDFYLFLAWGYTYQGSLGGNTDFLVDWLIF